jgi:HSP20 family protein
MNELDNLFSSDVSTPEHFVAPVDVQHTTDNSIVITMDVPGVDKDKITVDFEDGVLTIAGEKEAQAENEMNNRLYSERRYGRFERRLSVGRHVDFKNAVATVNNGVLSVSLPKLEAKKIESRIPIK